MARWGIFLAGAVLVLFFIRRPVWGAVACIAWGLATLEAWDRHRVPVLTWHSVTGDADWLGVPSITMPIRSFEMQMRWLALLRYRTILLDELYDLRREGRRPGRILALTFDDGYLDTWVGVLPVLQKHGLRGTVFVSSEWIDPGRQTRKQWCLAYDREIEWRGYMNRGELKSMQQSGVIDVQSHAATHDAIFISGRVTGFVPPDGRLPITLRQALCAGPRHAWHEEPAVVGPGEPLFEQGEALAAPRFEPDGGLVAMLRERAAEPGFFERADWPTRQFAAVEAWRAEGHPVGTTESPAQARERWRSELEGSRTELEHLLGKPVRHLAWPRTAWCAKSEALALDAGYLSTTVRTNSHNGPRDCNRIERIHMGATGWPALDTVRMIFEIWVFRGHYVWWPALAGLHWLSRRHYRGKAANH